MPDAPPDLGEIRFRRRRDAGDVLNATLRFLRVNVGELLRTYLVVVLPVALAAGVSWALLNSSLAGRFEDPFAVGQDVEAILGAPLVGTVLFGLLGQAITAAAAGAYVRLYREGRAGTITAGEVWDETRPLILPFVGLYSLAGLVFGASFLINVVPCLGSIAWLGFLLWAFPRLAVTVASRAVETDSIGAAWSRSLDLVKGSWGFALGALVLAVIVFYAVVLGASVPYFIVVFLAETNAAGPTAMVWIEVLAVPLQVVGYVATLILLLAGFFVHGRLVEELDGTSLYGDLDAIAAETGTHRSTAFGTEPSAETGPREDPPPASTPPADDRGDARGGGFRGGGFGG